MKGRKLRFCGSGVNLVGNNLTEEGFDRTGRHMSEVSDAPRPANQYPTLRSALRKVSPWMVVPLVYLLIGFVAFWPV